jgi:UDPglucose--hexose-1-phosphate uridylyltransferase
MSELRKDPITKEWVIIATERSRRPDEFREGPNDARRSASPDCPFCPGNEHLTPPETFAIRESGVPNGAGWRIRVVPNRFAALAPQTAKSQTENHALFRAVDGYGHHEVIIETHHHDRDLPLMSDKPKRRIAPIMRQGSERPVSLTRRNQR